MSVHSWAGDTVTVRRRADENRGHAGGRYFMQVNRTYWGIKSNGGFLVRIDTRGTQKKMTNQPGLRKGEL